MASKKITSEDGLLGYLDELVDHLRDLAPLAIREGDINAIHQARVTTRRLKAAIDLFDSVIADDQKQGPLKLLKRLRRRLGPLRDADVMVGHLLHLQAAKRWIRPAAWVADKLRQRRDEAFKQTQGKVDVPDLLGRLGQWWGVREQIREALGEPAEMMLRDSLLDQLHEFERAADRLIAAPAAGADPADRQDPHELRIAGKALRYTLELAKADGHAMPKSVLKQFKAIQEALGLWHDYVVLGQDAMRTDLEAELALHDSALHREMLSLAVETARRADAKLRQFGRLWQANGQAIRQVVESLFSMPAVPSAPIVPDAAEEPGEATAAPEEEQAG